MTGSSMPTVGGPSNESTMGGPALHQHQVGAADRAGQIDPHPGALRHRRPATHDVAEAGRHLVQGRGDVPRLGPRWHAERVADVLFVHEAVVVPDPHEPAVGLVTPGRRPRRSVEVRLGHRLEGREPPAGDLAEAIEQLVPD